LAVVLFVFIQMVHSKPAPQLGSIQASLLVLKSSIIQTRTN
jgi:hypothetical protein